jgi:uncharacterized glyoxalase superfamily protein PhnB
VPIFYPGSGDKSSQDRAFTSQVTVGPARLPLWFHFGQSEADFRRWQQAGARIVSEPEDKPWHLREFRVADLDDNQLRVFYDFTCDLPKEQA